MIILDCVTKRRKANGQTCDVLSLVSINIPSDRCIALFAPSVEDSDLVINLLAGVEPPTSGHIRRAANVSFPVGHTGGFQGELTLRHNIAHVARLYGANPSSIVNLMRSIAGLGDALDRRLRDLPSSLKRQFAQILAYSIPFDVYLLNGEPTRVSADQKELAWALFEARTRASGAIIAVRNTTFATKYCDMALCLLERKLVLFRDVEEALSATRASGPESGGRAQIDSTVHH